MITTIELIRVEKSEAGTFGVLKIDGKASCVTLEPEDRGNAQNVSCIPEGDYVVKRVNSPKYGDTFEITGVPGRSHILLHPGNTETDTKGCVLLGRNFGHLGPNRAVLSSGNTFKSFLQTMADNESAQMHITDASGGVR
ncbi:DUF5675 family protein [Pseudodesulfovibrio sediminis]|uniref:DUF5675 domain-containing protein n=1 Tax=Pseudodesulfovibrio sediminis TaxID=2810563 RepID=A0ABN6EYT4_9BACT|nr:DUF5675 family protein [Pseudodesulfovibrio sediminis]BCS89968.1 hypothetical protein PSDVSF_32100 [Pseudodesulfovibrio sediminis]